MDGDIQFADMPISPRWGTDHFLFVGATGSGKTTLINILMKSVFQSRRHFRAMVYDPKQEVLPVLYGMLGEDDERAKSPSSRVKVLHPLDARCCSWNLAADIDGPVSARQLATILIVDSGSESGGDVFFNNAVRDLLTGVMLAFIECVPKEKAWTFRDVVLAMLYEPYLRWILSFEVTRDGRPFPMLSRLRRSYLEGDPRTNSNIRASINAKMSIYEPIAAAWDLADKQKRTFSFKEWVRDSCADVLVLGNDEASRAALDAINQAMFKRATELLLAKAEAKEEVKRQGQNQTWFFLDEVREAGELDGLGRLMTKGRSKGACVVLGFQDIDGLRSVYGEEVAHEICGQCNHIAVLRLNSPSTADWSVNLFGKRLARSKSQSRNMSTSGEADMGRTMGEDERPYVYTSNFLYLPQTSPETGLSGFYKSPNLDPEQHELFAHLPWGTVAGLLPRKTDLPSVVEVAAFSRVAELPLNIARAAFLARPPAEHFLRVWDKADWEQFGYKEPFNDFLVIEAEKIRKTLHASEEAAALQNLEKAHKVKEIRFREEEREWRRQEWLWKLRDRQSKEEQAATDEGKDGSRLKQILEAFQKKGKGT
ncbi:hypothetical protein LBMAG21_00200 [Armatimonadota bacterium]|nr:hypothetical protein LBMAG21_00200 [Armatimonadota bacterium]